MELDYVRNPPGFNQFIDKLAQFRDYADEIEENNNWKWGRLQAMDNYLMNTFQSKLKQDEENAAKQTVTVTLKKSRGKKGVAGQVDSRDNSGNRIVTEINMIDPSHLSVKSSKVTQTLLHGYQVSNYEKKIRKYKQLAEDQLKK